jgi:hypothetical protein
MIGAGGALVIATPSPANCVCLIKPFENSSVVARENVPIALPLKVICTCPTLPGAIFSLGLICQLAFLYKYLPANSKEKSFSANTSQN